MIRQELSPDQPYLYIPESIFIGRGITQDGVYYEGFELKDGSIHYYETDTGKELKDA